MESGKICPKKSGDEGGHLKCARGVPLDRSGWQGKLNGDEDAHLNGVRGVPLDTSDWEGGVSPSSNRRSAFGHTIRFEIHS